MNGKTILGLTLVAWIFLGPASAFAAKGALSQLSWDVDFISTMFAVQIFGLVLPTVIAATMAWWKNHKSNQIKSSRINRFQARSRRALTSLRYAA